MTNFIMTNFIMTNFFFSDIFVFSSNLCDLNSFTEFISSYIKFNSVELSRLEGLGFAFSSTISLANNGKNYLNNFNGKKKWDFLFIQGKPYFDCGNISFVKSFNFNKCSFNANFSTILSKSDGSYSYSEPNQLKEFYPSSEGSSGYITIKNILDSPDLSLEDKQLSLEKNLHSLWVKHLDKISRSKDFLNTNPGFRLFLKNYNLLKEDLEMYFENERYIKNKKFLSILKEMDKSLMLFLTLSLLVPFTLKYKDNHEQSVTSLFHKLGKILYKECLYQKYINEVNVNLEDSISFKLYIKDYEVEEQDLINMGSTVINYLDIKSDLFDVWERYDVKTKKTNREIIPGKDLENYINYLGMIDSHELPMVIPGVQWMLDDNNEIKQYGGYIMNNIKNLNPLIRVKGSNESVSEFVNEMTVKMVNYMSSIGFCINNKVLDLILNLPLDDKIIVRTLHKDTGKISEYYDNKEKILDITSHNSKSLYNNTILTIAKLYQNVEQFYFPFFLDWRGRVYCQGGELNFQGGELARSLLLFKKGCVLTEDGLNALKVYGANAFGLDKLSITKRLEWVDKNLSNILDVDSGLWRDADEPTVFLGFCFELQGYYNDPSNFVSRLPIYLDATCNGVQHLAAMISDLDLASKVNLVESNIKDDPSDLYSLMLDPINEEIKKMGESDLEYSRLTSLLLNRKMVKRGLMTISYGVSVKGIFNQLINEHFVPYKKMDGKIFYKVKDSNDLFLISGKELMLLSKIIHKSLYLVHPSLNHLSNYFNKMVELLYNLNLPIIWLTPSGLLITQKYVKFTKVILTTKVLGKTKKVGIRSPVKTQIDRMKQVNAFIPNLVHSIDASHVALLINEIVSLNKDINILTVHDCFGTNANDAFTLQNMVKINFIRIYGNDEFIDRFHGFILNYLSENYYVDTDKCLVYDNENKFYEIPAKPQFMKTLDLTTQLMKSTYFIN